MSNQTTEEEQGGNHERLPWLEFYQEKETGKSYSFNMMSNQIIAVIITDVQCHSVTYTQKLSQYSWTLQSMYYYPSFVSAETGPNGVL